MYIFVAQEYVLMSAECQHSVSVLQKRGTKVQRKNEIAK